MNNKKVGTAWEKKFCEILSDEGFWAHRIEPDLRGAQPFDIIACKNDMAIAIDCKTCEDNYFRMNRVEENQKMAFGLWNDCGNSMSFFAVLHDGYIYRVCYSDLLRSGGKVKLDEDNRWKKFDG